jgi:hypothetical protein
MEPWHLKEFLTHCQTFPQPCIPSIFGEPPAKARKEVYPAIQILSDSQESLEVYVRGAEATSPEVIFTLQATGNNFNLRD